MTALKGVELLDNPVLNKDTAFTESERKEHGLEGHCHVKSWRLEKS